MEMPPQHFFGGLLDWCLCTSHHGLPHPTPHRLLNLGLSKTVDDLPQAQMRKVIWYRVIVCSHFIVRIWQVFCSFSRGDSVTGHNDLSCFCHSSCVCTLLMWHHEPLCQFIVNFLWTCLWAVPAALIIAWIIYKLMIPGVWSDCLISQ
jgi:hypothetical protein